MEQGYSELKNICRQASREMSRQLESLTGQMEQISQQKQILDAVGDLLAENEQLKADMENLQENNTQLLEQISAREEQFEGQLSAKDKQIKQLNESITNLNLRLDEASKMVARIAKKADDVSLINGLRVFINQSKTKTVQKRETVKHLVLELIQTTKVELPEDLAETLASFDDDWQKNAVQNTTNITVNDKGTYIEKQTNTKTE